MNTTAPDDPRAVLREVQLGKIRRIVRAALDSNAFYQTKLSEASVIAPPRSLAEFVEKVPTTSKAELVTDRESQPPYGSNLTYLPETYTRFCQTSGSRGEPLPWLDTNESWASMLDCWETVFRAAGVTPSYDRVFFAFSFGPFLGFWTAYEAAARMGCLTYPGGGMSGAARLACMETNAATVLCCTPTYALRLGSELTADNYPDLNVQRIIVAGEPGGSIPATRARISELWRGAEVFDHHGMTEVGPVSFPERDALAVIETHYFAEILDLDSGKEVEIGETGELLLTTLERDGCPLLRYRTGDLVKKEYFEHPEFGITLSLKGGILGRIDDMVIVRGVNIYPAAIESIIRAFAEAGEYQVRQASKNEMAELEVVVELDPKGDAEQIARELRSAFGLRIPVIAVPLGTLPSFEFKSDRWIVTE